MRTADHIGRIGALAAALGIGNVRRNATRATAAIAAALVVTAAVTAAPAPASSSDVPVPDKTALLMGGTSIPTWHDTDVEVIMSQFIAPTHPDQTIEPVALTTPSEGWPTSGIIRLGGFLQGPASIFGPGGAAWPDEPWWKLTGLFDLTYDQSTLAGVADLEDAMAAHGNDNLVIYGYSQGAMVANREKQRLAELYPDKNTAPDIDFVLSGDPNLPNGGLLARFPGLYVPIGFTFNGPEPTDTPFDTFVTIRQYDLLADFPLYPLNVVALVNVVMGGVYVHVYPFDVSLASDATTSPSTVTRHGDTTYYFFETQDLPLFAPLRQVGVPEPVIDIFEPFFRVLVELGYDRTIEPGVPTPARLFPTHLDPVKVATDLVGAVGEGVNNALSLGGSPAPSSSPASARTAPESGNVARTYSFEPAETRIKPTESTEITQKASDDVSSEVAVQQDTVEGAPTPTEDPESSVRPKMKNFASTLTDRPNSFIRSTVQKLIGRQTDGVPRRTSRWMSADRSGEAAATAPAGSSEDNSPGDADS